MTGRALKARRAALQASLDAVIAKHEAALGRVDAAEQARKFIAGRRRRRRPRPRAGFGVCRSTCSPNGLHRRSTALLGASPRGRRFTIRRSVVRNSAAVPV